MTLPLYSWILILYMTHFCALIQARDFYFSNFCDFGKPANMTISTSSSSYGLDMTGSIRASTRDWYNCNKDCDIILEPPPSDGIVLSVQDINLYRHSRECVDSVTIWQKSYGKWNELANKCDNSGPQVYMNDGPMRITFKTSRDPGYARTGKSFHIVYTTFYKRPCWKSNSFLCYPNNFCISKQLSCDGVNNCGDGSDESFSECKKTWTIVGGILGFFFLLIVVSTVICRRLRVGVNESSSASVTLPSPPPQINPAYSEDELPSYDDLEHRHPPKTPPDAEPPPYVNVEMMVAQQRPNNTQPQH